MDGRLRYPYRGVGKIHHADVAKIWALRTLVIPYLTKADYYVRMALKKGRTFGRSELIDVPAKKRGRPRKLSSARVVDFVPPMSPSNTSRTKKASKKSTPPVGTEVVAQPISPRLLADLYEARLRPTALYPESLETEEGKPAGTKWVV